MPTPDSFKRVGRSCNPAPKVAPIPNRPPRIYHPDKYQILMHPDPDVGLEYTLGCAIANIAGVRITSKQVSQIIAALQHEGIHLAL